MSKRSDEDRFLFVEELAESYNVELTDWEQRFVESMQSRDEYTPAQRSSIDSLIRKYGKAIRWIE